MDEARGWVWRQRESGRSDSEIAARLRSAGWDDEHIMALSSQLGVPFREEAPVGATFAEPRHPKPPPWQAPSTVSRGWVPLSFDGADRLHSPNGQYGLFATADADCRKHVLVLASARSVRWQAVLGANESHEGAVSDSGYVAVSVETHTQALTGDLRVFAPTGEQVLRKRPSACISHCGLSEDGGLAWCTTMRNPEKEASSNKLFVFLLSPPEQLFKADEPFGEIEAVRFEAGEVSVQTSELLGYRFSLKGVLLNREKIAVAEEDARIRVALRDANGYALLQIAQTRLRRTPVGEMQQDQRAVLVEMLQQAVASQVSDHTKAKAYRHLGEVASACGDSSAAILNFTRALALNPKAGVRKELQALQESSAAEHDGGNQGDREGGAPTDSSR